MKKLPKRVYIAWEEAGGNEESFLVASKDYYSLVAQHEIRQIGVYELVEKKNLVNKSELV